MAVLGHLPAEECRERREDEEGEQRDEDHQEEVGQGRCLSQGLFSWVGEMMDGSMKVGPGRAEVLVLGLGPGRVEVLVLGLGPLEGGIGVSPMGGSSAGRAQEGTPEDILLALSHLGKGDPQGAE